MPELSICVTRLVTPTISLDSHHMLRALPLLVLLACPSTRGFVASDRPLTARHFTFADTERTLPCQLSSKSPPLLCVDSARLRRALPRMLESPFKLPYEIPKMPKPFSDYEWDDSYPGTFKPGKRRENQDLEEVLEFWEGRPNPAALELPQDVQWQIPQKPPEDILSWLSRIGILADEVDEDQGSEGGGAAKGDSLLDDEFDLDEDVEEDAMLSDSIEI